MNELNFDFQRKWTTDLRTYWNRISEAILGMRANDEEITLNLIAENSLFMRFNSSKVRQNTWVDQKTVEVVYQRNQRRVHLNFELTLNEVADRALTQEILNHARQEANALPPDPFTQPFSNNGASEQDFSGELPSPEALIRQLTEGTHGSEFTGLLTLGPIVRANRNHLGQNHWFSAEQFIMDYSLYTVNGEGENKAVKSMYSGRKWNEAEFKNQFSAAFQKLQMLKKTSRSLQPGEYRAYLAPAAVHELSGMFSWNGLSLGAHLKGSSAFSSLFEGKQKLSPHFSIRENFELGLSPRFNSLGEVSDPVLPLVEKGEYKNFLVSSRTAKEAGVPSNQADINSWGHEYLRSPEILPGQLNENDILQKLNKGIYLSQLHYINWSHVPSARVTGMTRYACFWIEGGEIVAPIKDLRFDDTLFRLFGSCLEGLTKESEISPATDTYGHRQLGGVKLPGALVSAMNFVL